MMIYTLNVRGVFPVNCYALINEQSQHGFLVDPGAQGEDILAVIHEKHWQIEKILLTHGHFDHTGAVNFLRQNLDIPILIHENGKDCLQNTTLNLSTCCGEHILVDDASFVHDGDYIQLADGSLVLKVLHTPGHTQDSVIYYNADGHYALVGDTIFKGAVGSTEYSGGNKTDLAHSLKKIFALPADTILYSGHSRPALLAQEQQRNQRSMSIN